MSATTLPSYSVGTGRFAASDVLPAVPLVPRNLGLVVLQAYRSVISPLYGDVCKYYPSCSAYAVGAVQQHGLLKGSALTAARLARCHPWARGGVDDVPLHAHFRHDLTRYGFVVPSTDEAPAGASPRKD
ncbi:membrane protein insertion efficiency factor YidD [Microbacterium sp. 2C]|nr:membrane protein insertion efficiency factor YidD [Microbacterium paulum]